VCKEGSNRESSPGEFNEQWLQGGPVEVQSKEEQREGNSTMPRNDEDIQQDVLEELKREPRLEPDEIGVTVRDGTVTLTGKVEYGFQETAAERAASRLAGVRGVKSLIIVKPKVSPAELKREIEQALIRNVRTDAEHIQVEVKGHKVILRGMVSSLAEKEAAKDTAWSEPGVTEVEDAILVGA
jgi:osmotically-inducible protein OsmY